jgi:hypothetical protein
LLLTDFLLAIAGGHAMITPRFPPSASPQDPLKERNDS